MAVVYIDKVFVLNLSIDYLLLLTAARLTGAPLQRGRLLCGAAMGALYAVAVFLPGCAALGFYYFCARKMRRHLSNNTKNKLKRCI